MQTQQVNNKNNKRKVGRPRKSDSERWQDEQSSFDSECVKKQKVDDEQNERILALCNDMNERLSGQEKEIQTMQDRIQRMRDREVEQEDVIEEMQRTIEMQSKMLQITADSIDIRVETFVATEIMPKIEHLQVEYERFSEKLCAIDFRRVIGEDKSSSLKKEINEVKKDAKSSKDEFVLQIGKLQKETSDNFVALHKVINSDIAKMWTGVNEKLNVQTGKTLPEQFAVWNKKLQTDFNTQLPEIQKSISTHVVTRVAQALLHDAK